MYKWFNKTATLEHLTEGEIINPVEYVEKLKAFQKVGIKGTYIVEKKYKEHSEIGFHYYKLDTLIKYFSKTKVNELKIVFNNNGKISCY